MLRLCFFRNILIPSKDRAVLVPYSPFPIIRIFDILVEYWIFRNILILRNILVPNFLIVKIRIRVLGPKTNILI